MLRSTSICLCLSLLITFCIPVSATPKITLPDVMAICSSHEVIASLTTGMDNKGPRKKSKKGKKSKKRNYLDRKPKMKNGKHCPSM